MIRQFHFKNYFFRKCKGPKQDDKAARQFILDVYLGQNPDPDRMCYSHFTCATGQTDVVKLSKMSKTHSNWRLSSCILSTLQNRSFEF